MRLQPWWRMLLLAHSGRYCRLTSAIVSMAGTIFSSIWKICRPRPPNACAVSDIPTLCRPAALSVTDLMKSAGGSDMRSMLIERRRSVWEPISSVRTYFVSENMLVNCYAEERRDYLGPESPGLAPCIAQQVCPCAHVSCGRSQSSASMRY
ncbi:hypothetical protein FIBSPDRAFT_166070 [Athelia psychrophila]|uniref:Uncharacterized protein n=1 Tax=Athelia psychrophila TaxID=1759441 RepID=A0A166B4U5_9AGAM|nr:hypothetical protein FIBSPDRAFT_166070 [Fibularhizoctonia sp. CBS 109695]